MEKKYVIKTINYCDLKDFLNGSTDPAFTLDGVDFINDDPQKAIDVLKKAGFVEAEKFVIPKGAELLSKAKNGGAITFEFEYNGHKIELDIFFDDDEEDKYIQ